MQIDASIYSQFQAPDFMGSIERGMRMGDLMRQRRQAEQAQAEDQSLKAAYKANIVKGQDGSLSLDRKAFLSDLAGISPEKTLAYQEKFASMDKSDAEARAAKLKESQEKLGIIAQHLNSVRDQATYTRAVNGLKQQGFDTSDFPAQYDPSVVKSHQGRALTYLQQLDQQNKDRDYNLNARKVAVDEAKARGEGAAAKAPTSDQYKAAGFAHRVTQAEKIMEDLSKSGFDGNDRRSWAQKHIFNEARPVELQKQEQAQRNFVNAVLRRESGAAISKDEFDSARIQYFPQPGDSPEVLAQKRQNRLDVLAALKAESGKAFDLVGNQRQIVDAAMPGYQTTASRGATGGWGMSEAQAAPAPKVLKTSEIEW